MKTALDLLQRLEELGVQVRVNNGKIGLAGNRRHLQDDELLAAIRHFKPELLEILEAQGRHQFVRGPGIAASRLPAITPQSEASRRQGLPLSFAQQRLWVLCQLPGQSQAYHIPMGLRMDGQLRPAALRQALDRLVRRHEVLRSRIELREGEPVQVIQEPGGACFALEELDLGELSAAAQAEAVRARVHEHNTRAFDLAQGPLLRGLLLRRGPQWHELHIVQHHIVSDGWSMGIFMREFGALYAAGVEDPQQRDPLPPLAIQYGDYAAWQRRWFDAEALQAHSRYWQEQLQGAPELLELPTDFARPVQADLRGGAVPVSLSAELSRALRSLSQAQGCTLHQTLMAAWAVVLAKLSGQRDIVIGTPSANRDQAQLHELIGFFVNTLPLRLRLEDNPSLEALLSQARQVAIEAQDRQQLPFEQIVEIVKPARSLAHAPLFQAMFVWQNSEEGGELALPGLKLGMAGEFEPVAKYDIDLSLGEGPAGQGIHGMLGYASALFSEASMLRHVGYLQRVLEGFAAAHAERRLQHTRLADLDMLSAREREQLLVGFNQTEVPYPEGLVHELFEAQVRRKPEAIAVVCGEASLSYAELNARANQLADVLIGLGVQADDRVAICVERGLDMVVGLLGILKSGAAYVPLDPGYPEERLTYMLRDSAPKALLSHDEVDAALQARLVRASDGAELVRLDGGAASWRGPGAGACKADPQRPGLGPDHLAYVVYTSGSTGHPKGVMVTHRNVVGLISDDRYVTVGAGHTIAQASNMSFDAITFELWTALCKGARLVHVGKETLLDPMLLKQRIAQTGIDTMFVTTALVNRVAHEQPDCFGSLEYLLFGGEQVNAEAVQIIIERGKPKKLMHVYGPTETTTFSTGVELAGRYDEKRPIAIGAPLENVTHYVVSPQGQLQPVGVAGELWIGGRGVARGYLNQEALTREKFVADPFGTGRGGRLYRSGDLVRWLPDGTLEFIGRIDQQVKIRGFRIELGEIEARLARCEHVQEAAVLVREQGDGDKQLVAYLTPQAGAELDLARIRAELQAGLPEYMVPAAFVRMEAMPLTPNGKLDRKALPEPDDAAYARSDYEAPEGPVEEAIAAVWAELLKLKRVGRQDDFFKLGGHSLLAVRMAGRLRSRLGVEVAVRTVFAHTRLHELARAIEGAASARGSVLALTRPGQATPLSFAQQRLWLIDRMEGGSPHYNMSVLLPDAALDPDLAECALARIVQRHAVLRTVFLPGEEGPLQIVREQVPFRLRRHALAQLEPQAQQAAVERLLDEERSAVFDLERDLMLRACYLELGPGPHGLLMYTLHHIASDGWSLDIIRSEFAQEYQALQAGRASPLAPLAIQYADFAHWQRQWLQGEALEQQCAYWMEQLAGLPAVHAVPLDFPRPPRKSHRGAAVVLPLAAEPARRLLALARERGVTPFMLVHAALAYLLSCHSHSCDIVIATPTANRMQEELEPLVGFFVNTLVLRTDTRHADFGRLLAHVRQVNLDAQVHQDVPFELLVERLAPPRSTSYTPLFQLMLTMNTNEGGGLGPHEGPGHGERFIERCDAKFDLVVDAVLEERGGEFTWCYDSSLFSRATIGAMAAQLLRVLEAVAAQPDCALRAVPMLAPHELARLPRARTQAYPEEPVHRLFERQAARSPEAVALVADGRELSYGELDRLSGQWAHWLRKQGVRPGRPVGVCIGRSALSVVAMLAVFKAGGVYAPLDPAMPAARQEEVARSAGLTVLLTDATRAGLRPAGVPVRCMQEPALVAAVLAGPAAAPVALAPDHPAYLIHTSGSTGKPKGVLQTHRTLISLVHAQASEAHLSRAYTTLHMASLAFDVSLQEVATAWFTGARLVVVDEDSKLDLPALWRLIESQGVERIFLAPALAAQLFRDDLPRPGLREIVCAGEQLILTPGMVQYLREHGARLLNHYGPTETHLTSACDVSALAAGDRPPIGYPLANHLHYVVGPHGQLAPPGAVGELLVGGAGLALGYLNAPELTAQRFIANPFGAGRLYRTGDLVRWREDGQLDFVGRIDDQVKIRGFRIEVAEVEHHLAQLSDVRAAAVRVLAGPQGKYLAAYLAVSPDAVADAPDAFVRRARQEAAERLPDYMVPTAWVLVDDLPRNASEKIDRSRLPLPGPDAGARAPYVAPLTPLQAWLAQVWQELLGCAPPGLDDNFFHLGGHSLLCVQLAIRIERRYGRAMPVVHLFQHQTLGAMAAMIEEKCGADPAGEVLVLRAGGAGRPVVLVPGMGGSCHVFYALVPSIAPSHPVYGLDAVGLQGEQAPHTSIEAIARHNVACLQAQGLARDIVLVGYSLGACVAFEMAKELAGLGLPVARLVLVDGSPRLAGDIVLDAPARAELTRVEQACLHLLQTQGRIAYTAQGSVSGLCVVRASANDKDLAQAWQPHAQSPVELHQIEADHFSLMHAPAVSDLGRVLVAGLARTDGGQEVKP